MNVQFSVKIVELSDKLKDQMTKKLDRLAKVLTPSARVEVTIEGTGGAVSGDQGVVSLKAVEPKNTWYSKQEGVNILDSLDQAVNSMYHEITRGKTKHRDADRDQARKIKQQLQNK